MDILKSMGIDDPVAAMVVAGIVGFGIFLIVREFLCWYWKINATLSKLDRIADRLDDLLDRLPSGAADSPRTRIPVLGNKRAIRPDPDTAAE